MNIMNVTHEPYYAGDGSAAVLFCHGFTASPWTMREWAQRTATAGYRVSVPRLPGHGTSWQELSATGWEDWYARIELEYLRLKAEHAQVYLAGLSLGGALALYLAEQYPDDTAGLILVNPAVRGDFKTQLAPYLAPFVKSIGSIGSDIAKPGVLEYTYQRTPLKPVVSMLQFWARVRSCLDLVTCPLLLYRSAVDHVVPAASSQFIMEHVSSEDLTEIVLDNSYHVATMDKDKELIFAGTIDFIKQSQAKVRSFASSRFVQFGL